MQYRPPQVLAATATTFTTTSSSSPRSSPRSSSRRRTPTVWRAHGRAGKSGIAILLYGEREGGVVRALEQRAGVKFIRSGPPSLEKVMEAAAQLVPRRLNDVDAKVLPFFEKEAAEVLASPDAAEKVAAALALVAGKSEIAQRSLLTGEDNMKTVLLEATDNSALSPADVMATVGELERHIKYDHPRDAVGKIRVCYDASKLVFDLPMELADELVAAAAEYSPGDGDGDGRRRFSILQRGAAKLSACVDLPPLRCALPRRGAAAAAAAVAATAAAAAAATAAAVAEATAAAAAAGTAARAAAAATAAAAVAAATAAAAAAAAATAVVAAAAAATAAAAAAVGTVAAAAAAAAATAAAAAAAVAATTATESAPRERPALLRDSQPMQPFPPVCRGGALITRNGIDTTCTGGSTGGLPRAHAPRAPLAPSDDGLGVGVAPHLARRLLLHPPHVLGEDVGVVIKIRRRRARVEVRRESERRRLTLRRALAARGAGLVADEQRALQEGGGAHHLAGAAHAAAQPQPPRQLDVGGGDGDAAAALPQPERVADANVVGGLHVAAQRADGEFSQRPRALLAVVEHEN